MIGGGAERSTSASESISESVSNMFSRAGSDSFGVGASQSYVDPAQAPFLAAMRGGAMGAADPRAAAAGARSAGRVVNPALDGALGAMGGLMDYGSEVAAGERSLASGLGRLFREEIDPSLRSNAIGMGGLGGGRQGVAQGVAAGQLASAYTEGLGDIMSRARATSLGAASALPGLAQARFASGERPGMAGLDVYARLASVLGAPTILTRAMDESGSRQRSRAGSASRSRAAGSSRAESLGYNFRFGG